MSEKKTNFTIVLFAPEIPGNTGSIGRTCVALGGRLVLIKPLAFDIDEKAVRRAGLDYWKYVDLCIYENWPDFLAKENPSEDDLHFFTKNAKKPIFEANLTHHPYLIFGSETKGLPDFIFESYPQKLLGLPMYSEHIRSLNLSNAACAVAYETIRQQKF